VGTRKRYSAATVTMRVHAFPAAHGREHVNAARGGRNGLGSPQICTFLSRFPHPVWGPLRFAFALDLCWKQPKAQQCADVKVKQLPTCGTDARPEEILREIARAPSELRDRSGRYVVICTSCWTCVRAHLTSSVPPAASSSGPDAGP
jgi:hypothetical protein